MILSTKFEGNLVIVESLMMQWIDVMQWIFVGKILVLLLVKSPFPPLGVRAQKLFKVSKLSVYIKLFGQ